MNKKLHPALIAFFSLVALTLFFISPNDKDRTFYNLATFLIWLIFFCDYTIRLLNSKNKLDFVKNNKIDLIAIIPFGSLFQAFNILRILRLFSITRTFYKQFMSLLKTNYFLYILYVSFAIILSSSLFMYFVEGVSFGDSLWWSFVTITTVGYGDIVPTTLIGRIIAITLMLTGIGIIGYISSTVTSFFINKDRFSKNTNSYKTEQLNLIKKHIDNVENLTYEDIDNICDTLKMLSNKDDVINIK